MSEAVDQVVPHQAPEESEAKLANYRELFRINQGLNSAIEGLNALKTAGLIRGELCSDLVDEYVDHVRELQALVNLSVTISLNTVEERDTARFIRARLDREQRAREEDEIDMSAITNRDAEEGRRGSVPGDRRAGAVVKG